MSESQKETAKVVDIDRLVSSMKRELDYYWSLGDIPDMGSKYCMIYKVQQHIREVDKFSYEPFMLSIGPYHNGASRLRGMEKMKWGFLDEILKLNCRTKLLDYLTTLQGLSKQARSCYSEDVKMGNEDFLQMLLLDGCFILIGLGGCKRLSAPTGGTQYPEHAADSISSTENIPTNQDQDLNSVEVSNESDQQSEQSGQWFIRFLNHDLFLLENQIPFFIVSKIFELVAGTEASASDWTDEIVIFVETALRWYPKAISESEKPKDFCHLLHLCHMYFRPSNRSEYEHCYHIRAQYFDKFLIFGRKYLKIGHDLDANDPSIPPSQEVDYLQGGQALNRWRRTSQYLEAGIKFKKRDYDNFKPHSLLDVKFTNGTMEIPCIIVDEYTGTLFRNLIAFEQTCPQFGDDFTAYIVFLSQLISMPEDVTVLARREIIVHHLDSDEMVSDLFTMLSKDVVFDFNGQYYLKSLCLTMETYYQSRLNRWIAWLWLNHFSNPWLGLAAFTAVLVLVCTIIQTVFGILAYTNPPG
ncbi:unnamed protein product [Urochloa decumbens]|uniref:Uncharacterized protein n=1 Tax=Urochloa decumbens TaxID=240449 RepID=A0ABC9D1Y5_9POAL